MNNNVLRKGINRRTRAQQFEDLKKYLKAEIDNKRYIKQLENENEGCTV
ncbi:uncharacterized protein G2W53_018102 [Senna tora]|uniref:Uncharacterized protein n=1 Tax=Senna tora TaxID=362788 RepID=A0A834WN16_9FABA|nr:uncharacterized protein G2W53_018102 [Senna tora]